ncbi:hypothetical protein [Acinetobacter sp. 5862]|uniref:hypothetical protein n=1 Tax=Acinetobacter sp. 5862 TaxID=2967169 RepID=UPI0021112D4B|nr:hypothetical protein [Acinetobacter sp. 5862]
MVVSAKKISWFISLIILFILFFIEFIYDEKWLYSSQNINETKKNLYDNCFMYQDNTHLKKISFDIIYNKFGKDIYDRQRRLTITEQDSKIVIYGHTQGVFREFFLFGGGGVVLLFDKNGSCIKLSEYLVEK